jgi:hypothetical protein
MSLTYREMRAQRSFEKRALKKLLSQWLSPKQVALLASKAGDDFGFESFDDNFSCPIRLFARKLKRVTIRDLFDRITKTEMWRTFFDIKKRLPPPGHLGLVFPVLRSTTYVAYVDPGIPPEPGYTSLVRPTHSNGPDLVVTPYEGFLRALKKKWTLS